MKAVNLLPEELRPRSASGALKGSSYAVVGVLGILLVMLVAYTLTTNGINDKKTELSEVKAETAEAEARAAKLGPYEDFARITATRIDSVKNLAGQRFDWERMMREIALVLPANTSLLELSAATAGGTDATGAVAPAPADPALAATAGPSLHLKGCAERQPDVATLMVRLRKLYRAVDVQLTESTEQDSESGAAPTDSGGGTTCPGDTYLFDVTVSFSAADPEGVEQLKVPARLGGGA
jgi:Tfp pilus assembly protein PilN